MSEMMDLISKAQSNDLAQEELRVQKEREQRRLLRLKSKNTGFTAGELMNKLTENMAPISTDESEELLTTKKQEVPNARHSNGFPPPPTSR